MGKLGGCPMAVYNLIFSSTTLPSCPPPSTPNNPKSMCGRGTQPASALINRAGEDVRSSNDTPQSRGLALTLGGKCICHLELI
jgi:hypothetical protein